MARKSLNIDSGYANTYDPRKFNRKYIDSQNDPFPVKSNQYQPAVTGEDYRFQQNSFAPTGANNNPNGFTPATSKNNYGYAAGTNYDWTKSNNNGFMQDIPRDNITPSAEGNIGLTSDQSGQAIDPTLTRESFTFHGDPAGRTAKESYYNNNFDGPEMDQTSGFETGGRVLQGFGSAAKGWAALQNIGVMEEHNRIAKDVGSANARLAGGALMSNIGGDAYAAARRSGLSEEDANAAASVAVNRAKIPSGLSGGSFKWT